MRDRGIISRSIPDSAAVQGKGVSPDADTIGVIISRLYRVLENQRGAGAARRISCRSISAAYNNGESRSAAEGMSA